MDFVRSYFGTNEPLTSQKVRKKVFNCQRFICTKVTSYKIHTLGAVYDKISLILILDNWCSKRFKCMVWNFKLLKKYIVQAESKEFCYLKLGSCNFKTYPSSTMEIHHRMKRMFQHRKIVMAIVQWKQNLVGSQYQWPVCQTILIEEMAWHHIYQLKLLKRYHIIIDFL